MKEFEDFNKLLFEKKAVCTLAKIDGAPFAVINHWDNSEDFVKCIFNAVLDEIEGNLIGNIDTAYYESVETMQDANRLKVTFRVYDEGDEDHQDYILSIIKTY